MAGFKALTIGIFISTLTFLMGTVYADYACISSYYSTSDCSGSPDSTNNYCLGTDLTSSCFYVDPDYATVSCNSCTYGCDSGTGSCKAAPPTTSTTTSTSTTSSTTIPTSTSTTTSIPAPTTTSTTTTTPPTLAIGTPSLISPTSNKLVYGTTATLTWTPVPGAGCYQYASESPAFTFGTTTSTSASVPLPVGGHFWKVRACTACTPAPSGCGAWSSNDWASVGEIGITDLKGSLFVSKNAVETTSVKVGDNIILSVTGEVSSGVVSLPRYMIALGVLYDGSWKYCYCDPFGNTPPYVPTQPCTIGGGQTKPNLCSHNWANTIDTAEACGETVTYSGVVYDYGSVGDTELVTGDISVLDKTVSSIKVCGNGVVECTEQCDPPESTAPCTTASGDAGTKTCSATCGWGACVPTCLKNEDCGAGRCCLRHTAPPEASGPEPGSATCVDKQIYTVKPEYLCDPGTWIKCDENKVGTKQEFDNRVFICTKENGIYKWEEKTVTTLPQPTKNEGFVIDLSNIFSGIIKLFVTLFII